MNDYIIRPATLDDIGAITEIYNQAIAHTVATFDTEEKSVTDRRDWFTRHDSRHPILVAEINGSILGWAAVSPWSDRAAYDATAEASLYIREEFQGRGIGRRLSEAVIEAGKKAGLHTLIARIAGDNEVSVRLAETQGFRHIGVMKEVGFKFGRLLDVVMMQMIFN